MPLQQVLTGNERGVALYKDGQFLGYEDVVTLSDKKIAERKTEKTEREAFENAEELIDNAEDINQIKGLLKMLVKRLAK